jgi:hypothetical protein
LTDIHISCEPDEYAEFVAKKTMLNLSWLECLARGLDIAVKERRIGRPSKSSLDEIFESTPWGKAQTEVADQVESGHENALDDLYGEWKKPEKAE